MARSIMSEIKRDHIHKLICQGEASGRTRAWDEFRPISIETNYIETRRRLRPGQAGQHRRAGRSEDGHRHARSRTPRTRECCPPTPSSSRWHPRPSSPDRQTRTPSSWPGSSTAASARAQMIDLEKLCIEPRKEVWMNFIDIYVLDYDGNLFDAAFLGAVAALKSDHGPGEGERQGRGLPAADQPHAHQPHCRADRKLYIGRPDSRRRKGRSSSSDRDH